MFARSILSCTPTPFVKIDFNSSQPVDLYFHVLAPVVQKLDSAIHKKSLSNE